MYDAKKGVRNHAKLNIGSNLVFQPPQFHVIDQWNFFSRKDCDLKKAIRGFLSLIKGLVVIAVAIEIFSFLVIVASNYLVYGHPHEGSPAVYDPYSLFLMEKGPRKTAFNSGSPDTEQNKVIWLLGSSTTRGDSGPYNETIASYLSKFLNKEGRPLHFTVANYGVNSFNSLLETKYLQKLLIESDELPDVIVFFDGANDVSYFAQYRTPHGHHGYRRVKGLIEGYSRTWFDS